MPNRGIHHFSINLLAVEIDCSSEAEVCQPHQLAYRQVQNLYIKELNFAEQEYCRLTRSLTNKEMSSHPHHWWNKVEIPLWSEKGS